MSPIIPSDQQLLALFSAMPEVISFKNYIIFYNQFLIMPLTYYMFS
jgi:hypothetical protein